MSKAAVLGHPIAHSKSPIIHNYWMQKHRLESTYEAIDVSEGHLKAKVEKLFERDYVGLNITVPHKERAVGVCGRLDDIVNYTGAVNTLYKKLGKIYGTNTDVYGFCENIRQERPGFDFKGGPAVVLGSGGAARAVVLGLLDEGVPEIHIYNRSRERAEKLALEAKDPTRLHVHDWGDREKHLSEAALLINTTVLGMQGKPALELSLEGLAEHALVNDIVYAPLHTPLLKAAMERGNPTVTGIGMLLHQASKAFEYWFDVLPQVDDELKDLVMM